MTGAATVQGGERGGTRLAFAGATMLLGGGSSSGTSPVVRRAEEWLGVGVAALMEADHAFSKTIVVINDSPEFLELAEMLLRDEQYEVKVAQFGQGALSLIKETRPDLVVLDVRLPDVSGWDVLQALKLDPSTAALPVLICTAAVHEIEGQAPRLDQIGVDVLIKPFSIEMFLDKVRALIER